MPLNSSTSSLISTRIQALPAPMHRPLSYLHRAGSAASFPLRGIWFYLRNREFWPLFVGRILPLSVISFLVYFVLFTFTFLPQYAFLAIFHGWGAWVNTVVLVLGEGLVIIQGLFEGFFVDECRVDVFDAALIKLSHKELIAPHRILFVDAPNAVRMLGKPTSPAIYTPWSIIQIVELIVFLPLNLVPIVGTPAFIIITGTRLGKLAHYRWFQLKGYSKVQQKKALRDRAWEYVWFGTVAMILELTPIFSLFFLLTTTAGAAIWVARIEDESRGPAVDDSSIRREESDSSAPPPYTDDLTHVRERREGVGQLSATPLGSFRKPLTATASSELHVLETIHGAGDDTYQNQWLNLRRDWSVTAYRLTAPAPRSFPLLPCLPRLHFPSRPIRSQRVIPNSSARSDGRSSPSSTGQAYNLLLPSPTRDLFLLSFILSSLHPLFSSTSILLAFENSHLLGPLVFPHSSSRPPLVCIPPVLLGLPPANTPTPHLLFTALTVFEHSTQSPWPTMRIFVSLGAIAVTGLLSHSGAQTVNYGDPNGSPSSSPGGGSGSIFPGNPNNGASDNMPFPNVPGAAPGSFPSGVGPNTGGNVPGGLPPSGPGGAAGGSSPGNVPGAGSVVIPSSVPTNASPNVPGAPGAPGSLGSSVVGGPILPTCPFLSTKTIIVTVHPTGPQGASGFPVPNHSAPGHTGAPAPFPTNSARISSPNANPAVSPFTTLTLDLWGSSGPGSGSGIQPSSGSGAGANDGASPGSDSGSGNDAGSSNDSNNANPNDGAGSDNGIGSSDGTDSGVGSGNGADSGVGSDDKGDSGVGDSSENGTDSGVGINSGNDPNSPFPPVSGSAPEYSDVASGGSSGDVPGGSGPNTQAPAPGPFQTSPPSGTGNVPVGQPQNPSAGPGQEASDSLPVTTQVGPQGQGENSPWPPTTSVGGNNGQPPSGWITITGQDGLPTVISVGDGPGPGPAQSLSLPPTGWITITGQDGLPTVINGGDGSAPGQVQPPPFPGSQDGNGQSLPNGIPPGVPLPLPSATGAPGSPGPFDIPGIPIPSEMPLPSGAPLPSGVPLPGGAPPASGDSGSGPGITTCATFTLIGTDGLPTVIDSTWVIPFSGPAGEASSQLPVTGVPQGSFSGIPTDVGSIPTGSVPVPASPADGSGSLATTTSTSYTLIGTDGLPTVVHTTWVIPSGAPGSGNPVGIPGPTSTEDSLQGLPTVGPAGVPTDLPSASGLDGLSPVTTCTSYTIISTDGLPTVVESTFVVPGPANTGSAVTGGPEVPSEASVALPNGMTSAPTTQASDTIGLPPFNPLGHGPGGPASDVITTCTSYTIIGTDGLPTVVDSTWVIPGAINTQSALPENPPFVTGVLPSGLPTGAPGQVTPSQALPSGGNPGGATGITTCISYTVIGTDGAPTVVESTLVIPTVTGLPSGTSLGLPSISGAPQPVPSDGSAGTFTSLTTAVIIGPDGQPTSTVQTVILSASSALGASGGVPQGTVSGLPSSLPSGPVFTTGDANPFSSGTPSLNDYGAGLPDESMSGIFAGSSADAQGDSVTGTVTGTRTWTVTSVVDSMGRPVFSTGMAEPLPSYDPLGNAASDQASEVTLWPLSAPSTSVQTSTWTNVIAAETTSYTINFPLTTLVTITVPGKRHIRRQEVSAWTNSSTTATSLTENTSLGASLSSALSTSSTLPTSLPTLSLTSSSSTTSDSQSTTSSATSSPSICATGVSIGNTTIDFDNSKAGPLFNPVENIWFSGGFLIAPPTSQQPQPYIPSSGGQLVEFVPPALSNTTTSGSGDVAQIGVGPHAASPCFRFDFFGARLGCDAHGPEKWCEFEISAYRWNETSSSEESIAWSETKQVPACPTFSEGGYELTPIELDGYTDLSSILITLRVSQELRVWWGDDFRVGWSDNSCVAASCRTNVPSLRAKRETVISALRMGVYKWARDGFERLDDTLV
ncbi:hypothetical protein FALBO_727 [Fusarium albosuccineum]|uniref:DUF7371 domain-containing protein n=1 Tax=Fusarium albosuccineum TaxID=1237068 RepID=A0A8H4LR50_9HYPO|nr:hypothetical protein FALBO_727 [Fusarium albosuccineum]